ncbi:MAG TPA: hypothetical protein VFN31_00675 [Candidatus Saccharimonadales bacterium]|nr:hypothetical protein [Candidatus Saccharimonadales bacterium]
MTTEHLEDTRGETHPSDMPTSALAICIDAEYNLVRCGITPDVKRALLKQGSKSLIMAFNSATKAIPKSELVGSRRSSEEQVSPAMRLVLSRLALYGHKYEVNYVGMAQSVLIEADASQYVTRKNQEDIVSSILNYQVEEAIIED